MGNQWPQQGLICISSALGTRDANHSVVALPLAWPSSLGLKVPPVPRWPLCPQTPRSGNESLSWAQQDPTAGKGGTRCLRCLGTALGHEATKGPSPEAPSSGNTEVQGTGSLIHQLPPAH